MFITRLRGPETERREKGGEKRTIRCRAGEPLSPTGAGPTTTWVTTREGKRVFRVQLPWMESWKKRRHCLERERRWGRSARAIPAYAGDGKCHGWKELIERESKRPRERSGRAIPASSPRHFRREEWLAGGRGRDWEAGWSAVYVGRACGLRSQWNGWVGNARRARAGWRWNRSDSTMKQFPIKYLARVEISIVEWG